MPNVMMFCELALGARFRYANSNGRIWIKLSDEGCGLIAEFNAAFISHRNWTGQSICSMGDSHEEAAATLVEFVS